MNKLLARLGLGVLLGLLIGLPTQARVFATGPWQALLDAGRSNEMERLAQARLREAPADMEAQAALAWSQITLADGRRVDAAARSMQDCVERHPEAALCHHVLASVMIMQARNGGALAVLRLARPIREHLLQALSLRPDFIEARSTLHQYYLLVPAIAGGGIDRARKLEQEIRASQPEFARLMRAREAGTAENWELMEKELVGVRLDADSSLLSEWRLVWGVLGKEWLDQGRFDKAVAGFERLLREQPRQALGAYGLGRSYHAMERYDDAIAQYERARQLDGAEDFPLDHRLGVSLQAKGEKALARAAFERYLKDRRASPGNARDCRRRLEELGPL